MEAGRAAPIAGSIARRAVDLALDGGISFDDASEHLCRLSSRRRAALEDALDVLPSAHEASAQEQCARLLLLRAIAGLASSHTS